MRTRRSWRAVAISSASCAAKTRLLSESDYQALLIFVGGSKPSASAIRSLPSPMPPKGLVPGSEKYLLGLEAAKRVLPSFRTDLIGFDQGAEVQLGQYQTGKGTSTLMSISYPTPQIARVRFGALTNFLGLNQDHGERNLTSSVCRSSRSEWRSAPRRRIAGWHRPSRPACRPTRSWNRNLVPFECKLGGRVRGEYSDCRSERPERGAGRSEVLEEVVWLL